VLHVFPATVEETVSNCHAFESVLTRSFLISGVYDSLKVVLSSDNDTSGVFCNDESVGKSDV